MSLPSRCAKEIFLQALELVTIAEREEYLDTQCGSDADLRREERYAAHEELPLLSSSPGTFGNVTPKSSEIFLRNSGLDASSFDELKPE